MDVAEKAQTIEAKIKQAAERSGRSAEQIQVVAVTKYVSNERAIEAVQAGYRHLGENRLEGLLEKQEYLQGKATWHFIGSLQSRKVKDVINKIDYLHSLDRISLAKEIQKRAEKKVRCFIQVNVSGEGQKHGIEPEKVLDFIEQLSKYDKIVIEGLMTMAPNTKDEEIIRKCFHDLAQIQNQIHTRQMPNAPCKELSMGMSNDYEIAIEEGSTFIRIGTALVGE
ncbi:YggS family pyridoxal phosphate-dependent enzyme [Jeotgalibacillus sp. ET6]|uniref:YggS family pyridoxal phosphate-dependent enzyme n=1 Tax=Jeotgalibacillus sp. ET6 TaxID=3037260 RepID=UPI0024184623|nr:YggS family pyridoxal phosphate-dependent enzyme [Jeotgalibacillus sp. ET6]MDG5470213.1 YggS family pyridoxal phosphate-dependent enzyme [Jeotgalibacillus sp. ET6]